MLRGETKKQQQKKTTTKKQKQKKKTGGWGGGGGGGGLGVLGGVGARGFGRGGLVSVELLFDSISFKFRNYFEFDNF